MNLQFKDTRNLIDSIEIEMEVVFLSMSEKVLKIGN